MAFFGSDGLENANKQLKAQLQSKNAQLSTLQAEQTKLLGKLDEAKKGKDTAVYDLQIEAGKTERIEKELQSKAVELSRIQAQFANLESSLKSENDRIKEEEKRAKGLEYQLDTAAFGGDDAARRSREEKDKLSARNKALEADNNSLRAKLANASVGPSSKAAGSRRRSTSLSADSRYLALQEENESLRAGQGPSSNDVDTLRNQLAKAKNDQNKAENSLVATEKRLQKEIEAVKDKLAEVNDELDFYGRNNGDGASPEELEKVKKAAQVEKNNLDGRIRELEQELEQKMKAIDGLERKADRVSELEAELESERARYTKLQAQSSATTSASAPPVDHVVEIRSLTAKIACLEIELDTARSMTLNTAVPEGNKLQIRQLQRDIRSKDREIEDLRLDVRDLKDDLLSHRSAIPVPGSPTGSMKSLPSIDMARLGELEAELEQKEFQHSEAARELEKQLDEAAQELEAKRMEVKTVQAAFDVYKGEMEAFTTQRDSFETELKQTREELEVAEKRVSVLEAEILKTRKELNSHESTNHKLRGDVNDADKRAKDAADTVVEKEELLSIATAELRRLQEVLAGRNHDDTEYETAVSALAEAHDEVQRSLAAEALGKEKVDQANIAVSAAEQQRDHAQKEINFLRAEIVALEAQSREAQEGSLSARQESESKLKSLEEQLEEAQADAQGLRFRMDDKESDLMSATARAEDLQNQNEEAVKAKIELEDRVIELEETLADRSTESEARQRDEEFFQFKEEAESSQKALFAERERHRSEIEAIDFAKTKDADEARQQIETLEGKIAELEQRIAELQSALVTASRSVENSEKQCVALKSALDASRPSTIPVSSNVRNYVAKIDALRLERDQARQSLSFVEHEQRFAMQDRASTSAELQRARSELNLKTSAVDALQVERDRQAEQLAQAEGSAAATSEEKERMEQALEQIQGDLETALGEKELLEGRTAELEKQNAALSSQLQEVVHHAAIRDRVDRGRSTPVESTFSRGHARQSSGASTSWALGIQARASESDRSRRDAERRLQEVEIANMSLQAEAATKVEAAAARVREIEVRLAEVEVELVRYREEIGVKEGEIEQLRKDKSRLKFNSKTDIEARDELIAEANEERDGLQTRLAQLSEELEQARKALHDDDLLRRGADGADSSIEELRLVTIALAAQKSVQHELQGRLIAATASLDQANTTIEQFRNGGQAVETAETEYAQAVSRLAEFEIQVRTMRDEIETARMDGATARSDVVRLTVALDEARAEAASHVEGSSSRLADLDRMVSELEASQTAADERIQVQQADVEQLLMKLAAAEKTKAEAVVEVEVQLAAVQTREVEATTARTAAEHKLSTLQSEYDTLLENLTGAEDTITSLTHQHEEKVKCLLTDQQVAIDEVIDLKAQMTAASEKLDAANAQVDGLRATLEEEEQRGLDSSASSISQLSTISALREQLAESEAASATIALERDALHNRIGDLQNTIASAETASAQVATERDTLQIQIGEMAAKIEDSETVRNRLIEDIAGQTQQYARVTQDLEAVKTELAGARAEGSKQRADISSLRDTLEKAEKESERTASMLKLSENEAKNLNTALTQLRERLHTAQQEAAEALAMSKAEQIKVAQLSADNDRLKVSLAAMPTASSSTSAEETDSLGERIKELEASLTLKVQEVDEADDRVREMYKTNAKLEKKVAKLQRQLTSASTNVVVDQTVANTIANKNIAPASEMPPPPVPAPVVKVTAASAVQRQPLRSINVFDVAKTGQTPLAGAKRQRETDGDEKPLPAECITLPPTTAVIPPTSAKKTPSRASFTPQRSNAFALRDPSTNVFAAPDSSTKTTAKNASARPMSLDASLTRNTFHLPQQ